MRTLSRFAAAAVLAGAGLAAAAPLEAELPAVRDAAARGNVKVVDAAKARFAGHPLEPYPHYWLLAPQLDRVDAAEVRAFLARFPDTPLAEQLRREWLRALATSGRWDLFRAEFPRFAGEDLELTCFSFQERLARTDAELPGEARTLFVAGRETPLACEPVFAALAASGEIAPAHVWERVRKLLAANQLPQAKRTITLLAPRSRFNDKTLDRAAAEPAAFLAREKSPILGRETRELVVFAVGRLARSRPEEAAERLALFAQRLGPEAAAFAWGQVAWQAALAHHPRALDWYRMAAGTPLTDAQAAWRARAAMRAGAWKDLLVAIQALSPSEARDPTWRYWRARALAALGEAEPARGLLEGLAKEHHFYGILAAEELGVARMPEWNGWKPQPEDLARVGARPGVQRALALYRLDWDADAFREWVWALRGYDDRDLLAAAELARQAGEPDRAVNTADRTAQLHDFSQRYPTPHRDAIAAAARQWGLDEALMYAIIRQESRFMPEARSRVGATGLMQLMPATARWVARQIPVHHYKPELLTRPEVNVNMGTYYFARVLAELGHPMLATAAYNAGPGRARRWREERALDGVVYAETIPFNETRDYVKKVFANAWYYRHRLTGQPGNLRQLVGMVPGRNGEPAQASYASNLP
jgi:soluble lytic murein transglycosylase